MNIRDFEKLDIPKKPGVYFFKQGDTILYIGKATNLYHRTKSYLQKNLMETRGPFIVRMIDEAKHLEFTETESALEALLLESYLIKQNQPEYNTREKDNRSYNYVVITNEVFPRIFTVRQRSLNIMRGKSDDSLLHVFGPFPNRDQLQTALKIIRKIFPFYGKKSIHRNNYEFYKQLGLLPDDSHSQAAEMYHKNIEYIALFFKGQKKSLIKKLKKDMMAYAKNLQFEKAEVLKNQMYALEHIHDIALMKHDFEVSSYITSFRMEAYDIAHLQGSAMMGVMVVYQGSEIDSSEHRVFKIRLVDRSNDTQALHETISRRLRHPEWAYPNIIIVDGGIAQKRVAEKAVRECDLSIPVIAVVKDERHKARELLGQQKLSQKYHREIVALNNESHRFALLQHSKKRDREFLK